MGRASRHCRLIQNRKRDGALPMTRDSIRRQRASRVSVSARRQRLAASIEVLDDRTLMSGFYTGPSLSRPIQSTGGLYTFSVSGPGLLNVHRAAHGQFSLSVL